MGKWLQALRRISLQDERSGRPANADLMRFEGVIADE
jgi:hypothetical protein